jgi:hypothetical protein
MPTSPVNLLWLTDAHDLQGMPLQLDPNSWEPYCDVCSPQLVTIVENQNLVLNRLTFGEHLATGGVSGFRLNGYGPRRAC